MGSYKKYLPQALFVLLILFLFFFTRLYNILNLPIFTDEALYIRWAQIAKQDAAWRFISLVDGKQPSFIWFTIITLKLFQDPLLAGRIVSVAAGAASVIGFFFLGRELFKNKWIGLVSSFLYVLFPMALVYDRMALYDSLVTMFAVWALYFEVLLVRRIRLDIALILGMILGGGVLTKSNAFFNIYLLPFSLLLFNWKQKNYRHPLLRWAIYAGIAGVFGFGYYQILRLSAYFHVIEEKTKIFVYPFDEWIKHPFTYFTNNLYAMCDWMITYLTIPILFLALFSFVVDFFLKKSVKNSFLSEKLLIVMWFLFPFSALAFFGNNIYPRFIFFMIAPLLLLAAYSLVKISQIPFFAKNKVMLVIVYIVSISFFIRSDYFILFNFAKAPLPKSDLGQYYNDWPAGGGVREAVEIFRKEAETKKIYVATQGTFGLLPHAIEIYLVDHPNITIEGIWPIKDDIPQHLLDKSRTMPVYLVFYQECTSCGGKKGIAPIGWQKNLKTILTHQKPAPAALFTVYQVIP